MSNEKELAPVYDDDDLRFGRDAIRLGYLQPDKMKVAISEQAQLAAKGEKKKLSEILVKQGALSEQSVAMIQKDTVLEADRSPADRSPATATTPTDTGTSPVLVNGAVIGTWKLEEEIGRGGMGIIFRARSEKTREVAALKILRDPGRMKHVERFMREMEATSRLVHPNIVRLLEVGQTGDLPWYAMELVPGIQLDQWVKEHKVERRDAVMIVRDVARAVHHAHAQGVIHRDLKPQNILMTKDGVPKVMDFGLAKLTDDDRKITRTNAGIGTPQYMSPEQALGQACDRRTDVFSLGIVLFELLAGRLPWTSTTMIEVCSDVVNQPLPAFHDDRALDRVLQKACEKVAAERYATAEALALDLDAWLTSGAVSARPPHIAKRIVRIGRRHVQALSGAAIASLVFIPVIAAVSLRALRSKTPDDALHVTPLFSNAAEVEAFGQLEARVREAVAKDDIAAASSETRAFAASNVSSAARKGAAELEQNVLAQGRRLVAAVADRGDGAADSDPDEGARALDALRKLRLPAALEPERDARATALAGKLQLSRAALDISRTARAATELVEKGDLDGAAALLEPVRARSSSELDLVRARLARLEDGRTKLKATGLPDDASPERFPPLVKPADRTAVAEYLLVVHRAEPALALAEAAGDAALAERARTLLATEEARGAEGALREAAARARSETKIPAEAASNLAALVAKHKAALAFGPLRDELRSAYEGARQRALAQDPTLLSLGGRARLENGVFSLVYGWRDQQAAQGWLADKDTPGSSFRVDVSRGIAIVHGHATSAARFVGKVRVRALAGSQEGDAPNVNVVLGDRGSSGLLVGLGYSEEREAALPDGTRVALPGTVIGLMEAGKLSFLKAASGGLLEATPARPVRLDILRDETSVVAKVDGSILAQLDGLPAPVSGGVGWRPGHSSALVLAETRLEGKLDPAWLDATVHEQARRDAEDLFK
jgi:tRNA A-37 threonylcarbamoyl transferase component Bud32